MKKLPRWIKSLLCLVLTVTAWLVLYRIWEGPSLTAKAALRRQEREELLGPTQIVDTIQFSVAADTYMIVGKSDYGYTTFSWWKNTWDNGNLHYFAKTGDITLFCPGNAYYLGVNGRREMPIFVFTELPGARSAVLELRFTYEGVTESFRMEAQLQPNGYFLLLLTEQELDYAAFRHLQEAMETDFDPSDSAVATVTVLNGLGDELGSTTKEFG